MTRLLHVHPSSRTAGQPQRKAAISATAAAMSNQEQKVPERPAWTASIELISPPPAPGT